MTRTDQYVGFVCNHPCIPYSLGQEKCRLGPGVKMSAQDALKFVKDKWGTHGFIIEKSPTIEDPQAFAEFFNTHNGLALPVVDGDVLVE